MFKLMDLEQTMGTEQRYTIDWDARVSAASRASAA